ncbi:MAG: hypothetical protein NWQ18_02510 [Saprospiraceae bacterium]|nr:hypothetical protein [Saprospiraceae bacterium]
MKQIVFTLLLMAAAFQGYSKNTLLEEAVLKTTETVLVDHLSTPALVDDCRITLRASIGFVMMEVSVSAPTCRGAFNQAMTALREAATSAKDALK